MRGIAVGIVTITMAASTAYADGYGRTPTYASFTWTGPYIGVNGGYGWSAENNQLACTVSFACGQLPFGVSPDGGFGGGQIGYNWQGVWHPHLVLGVEADFQGADISDRRTDKFGDILQSKLDWFGTVRGRLGYAFDRTLVYGTGGFAFGGIEKLGDFSPFPFADNVAKVDKTATGYVVGGGIEYKVAPAWSVKAEYQYINLGQNDPKFQSGLSFKRVSNTVDDDAFHTVRAGINYHFGGGYEPLK